MVPFSSSSRGSRLHHCEDFSTHRGCSLGLPLTTFWNLEILLLVNECPISYSFDFLVQVWPLFWRRWCPTYGCFRFYSSLFKSLIWGRDWWTVNLPTFSSILLSTGTWFVFPDASGSVVPEVSFETRKLYFFYSCPIVFFLWLSFVVRVFQSEVFSWLYPSYILSLYLVWTLFNLMHFSDILRILDVYQMLGTKEVFHYFIFSDWCTDVTSYTLFTPWDRQVCLLLFGYLGVWVRNLSLWGYTRGVFQRFW